MISGCATYRAGVGLPDTDTPVEALQALSAGHGRVLWVGLSDPAPEECERLASVLNLPATAARALAVEQTRATLEHAEDLLVLTAGVARYDKDRDLVEIGGLTVLLGEHLVVTVTRHASPEVRDLRWALERTGTDLARGPAGILHAHLEAVVSGYADVLRDLRTDVEALEREVFSESVSSNATQRIYLLKREAIDFQQATAALIDPLEDLIEDDDPVLTAIPNLEWAAVRDRLSRLVDRADGVSDLLGGILTAYQTDVALRQNEDMRKISAWVAIAAVPTMLAGIYGMNFEAMPELRQRWGYPAVLTVMVVACIALYRAFRSRNWL